MRILVFLLDFPSDCGIFSTFVGGYKDTAIAEKKKESLKSSLISEEKVNNKVVFGSEMDVELKSQEDSCRLFRTG